MDKQEAIQWMRDNKGNIVKALEKSISYVQEFPEEGEEKTLSEWINSYEPEKKSRSNHPLAVLAKFNDAYDLIIADEIRKGLIEGLIESGEVPFSEGN